MTMSSHHPLPDPLQKDLQGSLFSDAILRNLVDEVENRNQNQVFQIVKRAGRLRPGKTNAGTVLQKLTCPKNKREGSENLNIFSARSVSEHNRSFRLT